jgi:autotransporter translocation and assembly factor TamB
LANGAVVVLGARKASNVRIAATGQMLRLAGLPVRSAVLVGAGPEDESFWVLHPG